MAQEPEFRTELPTYLRLGFPQPKASAGEGLEVGSMRDIYLVGGEGEPGNLVMRVAERRPGYTKFEAVSDTSHMPHYMDIRWSEVEIVPAGEGLVRATWSLRYTRLLDPAWYFGPWQRYATGLAADCLLDNLVTPPGAEVVATY